MSALQLLLFNNLHHLTQWVAIGLPKDFKLGVNGLPPVGTDPNCPNTLDPPKPGGGVSPADSTLGDVLSGVGTILTGDNFDVRQVTAVLDAAGKLLAFLFQSVQDRPKFFHSVVGWFLDTFFPTSLQTWFNGTISGTTVQSNCGKTGANVNNVFGTMYDSTTGAAAIISAAAAACRVLRSMLDGRVSGMVMIVDTLPRFFIAFVCSQFFGKDLLTAAVNASADFAWELTNGLLMGNKDWAGSLITTMMSTVFTGEFVVLLIIVVLPLLLLIGYAACLMVVRTIMLGFVFALASLCVATAAYDHKNKFFVWWMKLLVGTLMMPIILGSSIAISLRLAMDIAPVPFIGPLMAGIAMCCGLWFAGKAVHQLTWEGGFAHTGPIAAGMAAVALFAKLGTGAVAGGLAQQGGMLDKLAGAGTAGTSGFPSERKPPEPVAAGNGGNNAAPSGNNYYPNVAGQPTKRY